MAREIVVLFNQPEGLALIREHCRRAGVPVATLRDLLEVEIEKSGLQRRHRLRLDFDDILDRMDDEAKPE